MPADQLPQWTRPQTAPLIVSGRFALQKALHPVALKTTDRRTDRHYHCLVPLPPRLAGLRLITQYRIHAERVWLNTFASQMVNGDIHVHR